MAADAPNTPESTPSKDNFVVRQLHRMAEMGNRLPDPLTLFALMALAVVLASAALSGTSVTVLEGTPQAQSHEVLSLLSWEGIRWMFLNAIDNFMGFAPLGPVLTVMLGIGIAERTGFVTMGLRVLVESVPKSLITATLIFACVMSSMVADAGYIVLTPLGALIFAGLGRHPIAGLAAAYAGVSGGFSANLLITGLDPMLARLTGQAAQIIDPSYAVNATSNYYFMVASTVFVTAVGTWVTTKFVEPMLGEWDPAQASEPLESVEVVDGDERRNFLISMGVAALVAAGIAFLGAWSGSPLRDPIAEGDPAINTLNSYFQSVEVLIALLFMIPGIVYGVLNKSIKNDKDVAKMASETMGTMGSYIVLAFVAGQFIAYFSWSKIGVVTAVKGAILLESLNLSGIVLLLAFMAVSAVLNLFVGSASAKWAFMAPIFVPMLMMMDLSPEAVQAAYRVGDSVTNIITPLMPYLPIIIVFAQRYVKDIKIGTVLTVMLPYSVAFAIGWSILFIVWVFLGIPLGPGVGVSYAPMP
ncbi:AbgT family transporter [Bradymonas sediminis]|uniref:AbgT family transporter n=1 Tax=Bradymonas sediminis TaxID=1548548 RepID=A0A2Z4FJY6_9DELT|nr:AbgT family transporter [Bradymonas sediminis]AWV89259.1 AbgT family transporter [Bradymonas sediminis]TDP73430.1 aminobenzoyl-glutamate transport protein [Bradymonas sediminis]